LEHCLFFPTGYIIFFRRLETTSQVMTQVMTTIPDLGDGKKDAGKPV
jgi:hypothetical protein